MVQSNPKNGTKRGAKVRKTGLNLSIRGLSVLAVSDSVSIFSVVNGRILNMLISKNITKIGSGIKGAWPGHSHVQLSINYQSVNS